jgi:hypothetical protein
LRSRRPAHSVYCRVRAALLRLNEAQRQQQRRPKVSDRGVIRVCRNGPLVCHRRPFLTPLALEECPFTGWKGWSNNWAWRCPPRRKMGTAERRRETGPGRAGGVDPAGGARQRAAKRRHGRADSARELGHRFYFSGLAKAASSSGSVGSVRARVTPGLRANPVTPRVTAMSLLTANPPPAPSTFSILQ